MVPLRPTRAKTLSTLGWGLIVAALAILFVSQVFWIVMLMFGIVVVLLGQQAERQARERDRPYLALDGTEVKHATIGHFTKPSIAGPPYAASYSTSQVTLLIAPTFAATADASKQSPGVPPAQRHPCFARVLATNDPPDGGPGVTAEKVTATVTFVDEDGDVLLEGALRARWANSKQTHEHQRVGYEYEHLEKDIEANDLPEPIDIAMKYPGEKDCFAWTDENSLAPGGKLEAHRLRGTSFFVDVVVKGKNTPRISRRYVLTNPGKNYDLRLVPLDHPPVL